MSRPAGQLQEMIWEWIMECNLQELEDNLNELELSTVGTRREKMDRLSRWLEGNYTAPDFLMDGNQDEAIERRLRKRENFIQVKCETEKTSDTIAKDGTEQEHPLNKLRSSKLVQLNLNRTTGLHLPPSTNSQATQQDGPPEGQNEPQFSDGQSDQEESQQEEEPVWITLTTHEGRRFRVPREFTIMLANLIGTVRNLQGTVEELSRQLIVTNRRVDEVHAQTTQQVKFADTFDIHYDDVPISTPRRGSSTRTATNDPPINPTWVGGNQTGQGTAQNQETRPPGRNYPRPPTQGPAYDWPPEQRSGQRNLWPTSTNTPPSHGYTRDIGAIVRKWQLKFTGDRTQSIDLFLSKLEDARLMAGLSREEVLPSLSVLFADRAEAWYESNKNKWRCWEEFVDRARHWYGSSRSFHQRVMAEANARTQGPDEPVRDYITCLVALMQKVEPELSLNHQLDLLHRNLRPQLQIMIRRVEANSIEGFLDLAVEAEQAVEYSKTYHQPPPAETTLFPEMGYKLSTQTGPPPTTHIGAVGGQFSPASQQDIISDIQKMLVETFKAFREENRKPFRANTQPVKTEKTKSANNSPSRNARWPRRQRSPPKTKDVPKTPPKMEAPKKRSPDRKANGPKDPIQCKKCGRLGYSLRFCPDCSGNGNRSD